MIVRTNIGDIAIEETPDTCPHCHKSITVNILSGYKVTNLLEVFVACPNSNCCRVFIAQYQYSTIYDWTYIGNATQATVIGKKFSEDIDNLSSSFTIIYNQALHAEQIGLNEICGVGYRKAFEFLIKDYAKNKFPTDIEKIEKKMLGTCITEYVDDLRIQKVAKRAVWLGNDETHYVRKWENKDLIDLKKLIDLTIHWIEMEILTTEIEMDMPE